MRQRFQASARRAVRVPRYIVYIVSCSDGTLYTGIARDLTSRLKKHNAGVGARYTRSRLPVSLVYSEVASNRAMAQIREAEIKKMDRAGKLRLAGSKTTQSSR